MGLINWQAVKKSIITIAIMASVGGSAMAVVAPTVAMAADSKTCTHSFLGFPAWYKGLIDSDCNIKPVGDSDGQVKMNTFIWTIALNVLDDVLLFGGYLSFAYIMYGGFLMLTSRGKASDIADGQVTVRNAVIGFVISFGSVPIVGIISDIIMKGGDTGVSKIEADVVFRDVVNMIYMVGGITAVIAIIISGYMYTISGGNPSEVEKAKNSIFYAIIGLVTISIAFTITQFVIGRF